MALSCAWRMTECGTECGTEFENRHGYAMHKRKDCGGLVEGEGQLPSIELKAENE